MGIIESGILALLSAIGGWFGGFFGAYLKKKGENLATHEDMNKVIVQMTATTEATKAIEARIDDQVWNRQRQWELKRDTIIEAVRVTGKAECAVKHAIISLDMESKRGAFASAEIRDKVGAELDDCIEYVTTFDGLRLMMALTVDVETVRAFSDMKEAYYQAVMCMDVKDFNRERAQDRINDLLKAIGRFHITARLEMGIKSEWNEPKPQSTESSTTQGPTPVS